MRKPRINPLTFSGKSTLRTDPKSVKLESHILESRFICLCTLDYHTVKVIEAEDLNVCLDPWFHVRCIPPSNRNRPTTRLTPNLMVGYFDIIVNVDLQYYPIEPSPTTGDHLLADVGAFLTKYGYLSAIDKLVVEATITTFLESAS